MYKSKDDEKYSKESVEFPKPIKEILWLMQRFGETSGTKKEKYKQKIVNWKRTHPKYNKVLIEMLNNQNK